MAPQGAGAPAESVCLEKALPIRGTKRHASRNDSTQCGRACNVVPGPAYQMNGEPCREYTHTVYIDGQPQTGRGTACRNPDGSWTTIS